MIYAETKVKLPFLWGESVFQKKLWRQVNLIVGQNGSGKTLLACGLKEQFCKLGYKVSFLQSERIAQEEIFEEIKENLSVRNKIEYVLSEMFGKSIRFEELPCGKVIPMVINKFTNAEYSLKDGECHGLKEIITLLYALYGNDSKCLILDEPELHLHPQFQLFFMNEIRKAAQEFPNRVFFLITHSPFFIDLRQPEDLIGVIVCHVNRPPSYIENICEEDLFLFRRFLPRFNTYHKQFFFSDNQIFVEGYTDQQIFTYLLNCIEPFGNRIGTGIIDVGGKDELGVFFKVCSLLGTGSRIITDLDSLFCGKLRDVVCQDIRPKLWLEEQKEKQYSFYTMIFSKKELEINITLKSLILKLEYMLIEIGKSACFSNEKKSGKIDAFVEKIFALYNKYENPENMDTFKTIVLQGVKYLGEELISILPPYSIPFISLSYKLSDYIFEAFEKASVFILHKGCIEHYYTQNESRYMPISGKDKLFRIELEHIINAPKDSLQKEYSHLVSVLRKACITDVKAY